MANNIISKIDGKFINDPSAIYKLTPNASTYTAQISDPTSTYSTTSIIRLPSDVMLNSSDGAVYSQKGHIHGVNISGTVSTVSAGTPTGTVSIPSITANSTKPSISRLTSISGSLSTSSTASGGVLSTWTYNSANESLTFSRVNLSATLNKTSTSMTVVTDATPEMSSNPIFYGDALATHTHSFNVNGYATGEAIKANNKIIYLSSSGVIAPYDTTVFGASIVSNTCENGVGTILFNGNVTSIGNRAFYTRSTLNGIIIPDTVTSFGNQSLQGCTSITSINIPSSVTSLGTSSLYYCQNISRLNIPASVNSIGYAALGGCPNLSSITVDAGNTTYDSRNNCNAIIQTSSNTLIAGCKNTVIPNDVTIIGEAAFYASGITSVNIGNNVTRIKYKAFQLCANMTTCTIGKSVTNIEYEAFSGCTSLTSITSLNTNPPTLGTNALQNVPATCPIYVPASAVNTYKSASGWSARAPYIYPIALPDIEFAEDCIFYVPLKDNTVTEYFTGAVGAPTASSCVANYNSNYQAYVLYCTGTKFQSAALRWTGDNILNQFANNISNTQYTIAIYARFISQVGNKYSSLVSATSIVKTYAETQVYPRTEICPARYGSMDTNWHWYVVTRNGAAIIWYQDGVQKASSSWSTNTYDYPYDLTLCDLHENNTNMSMDIRDVRVYKRVLTQAEIATFATV